MKHSIYRTRYYLLFDLGLIVLFILINCVKVHSQELQSSIEANHKIYVPDGKGPFQIAIAIPGCSGVSLNGLETDVGRLGDEGDRLFRRHY
jgi:hypothetical protein